MMNSILISHNFEDVDWSNHVLQIGKDSQGRSFLSLRKFDLKNLFLSFVGLGKNHPQILGFFESIRAWLKIYDFSTASIQEAAQDILDRLNHQEGTSPLLQKNIKFINQQIIQDSCKKLVVLVEKCNVSQLSIEKKVFGFSSLKGKKKSLRNPTMNKAPEKQKDSEKKELRTLSKVDANKTNPSQKNSTFLATLAKACLLSLLIWKGGQVIRPGKDTFMEKGQLIDATLSPLKGDQSDSSLLDFMYSKNPITGSQELHLSNIFPEKGGRPLPMKNPHDESVQTRLQSIINKVSKHAQRPLDRFPYVGVVVNSTNTGARSLSRGKLSFDRNLIEMIDNFDLSEWPGLKPDDLLAYIVSHEVAHSAIGHASQKYWNGKVHTLLSFVTSLMFYDPIPAILLNPIQWLFFSTRESHRCEFEADKYAIKFMYEAGYDIRGSLATIKLMDKIKDDMIGKEELLKECKKVKNLIAFVEWAISWTKWLAVTLTFTHPPLNERFEMNQKTVNSIFSHHQCNNPHALFPDTSMGTILN